MNNVKLWFEQAGPDYYLFFLKAWIPFNAWYVSEYPQLKKNDTDIIKSLQDSTDSKPKKIIKNFLDSKDNHESLLFQSYFAELHYQLEQIPFVHNGVRLSFKSLSLTENPVTFRNDIDALGNAYKVEKTSSYFQAYIQAKGGKVLLDLRKPIYDLADLDRDSNFIRLDRSIKQKITGLYEQINPKKPTSIIPKGNKNKQTISLRGKNSCKIISDTDTVAKGCIKILYALRCMLFHGEIEPSNTNKKVYENAFYILHLIINK
ncbi:MAG: hypothetical protein EOO44_13765, partial [Flavobacterium sp.]